MINIKFSAVLYQEILIRASLHSINGFNILDEKNYEKLSPPERWRGRYFVADFIYRNLQSELIKKVTYGEITAEDESSLSIAERFLVTPFDNNSEDSLVLWNAVNFQGANKLLEILKKYGLLEWDAINSDAEIKFISEIGNIYHSYGLDELEFI